MPLSELEKYRRQKAERMEGRPEYVVTATEYCPSPAAARDAMAKFLANGFNLQLYGP